MTTIHQLPGANVDPKPVIVELGNARPVAATGSRTGVDAAPVEPRQKRKYTRRTPPQTEETLNDGD